ncbi:hypothetical protein THAOC_30327 [Thalassiosira oceanica]|uniref:Methyltransferase domain-containing protein n=2 Tax=Thalassiosira oceanica TaxID=159749 RepID=K0RBR8_THAOC|nr:hypothetical protein THAOC_30327 [Thalassiosira oceanica]|eukprot:EJK50635.1 hypothetical protein THAOC_30327 [Thalassiosira oceanica]
MADSPSFLPAAGAAIALFAAKKVLDRFDLMDKICNRTYIYNICWEDPAVDHQVLNITHDDVIFRICSAGDIVLDYAIEGPSKIVVCDMNLHQLWLFELKIRMLRDPKLTYEEWWGIWGDSDVETALKVWKRMRHTMSADGRKWWDGRMERVFRQGFATTGSTGFIVRAMLPLFMWVTGFNLREWAESGFSHEYMVRNARVLENSAKWFRWLFPGILAPFAGVPANQIGPEFYTTEFYEGILKQIFLDPAFGKSNYFWRFYCERGYKDQTCCPRTLQREHFNALKENSGCFEWHHATVQETMERVQAATFTKLVLLDHMDWMPNEMVHNEWIALQRATVPGAKILWRSAFTHNDDKPFFNNLDVNDLTPKWYAKDRGKSLLDFACLSCTALTPRNYVVKMYPGTFLSYMPRDDFPFIDSEPSLCQKASFLTKVKTSAKMILHPIIGSGADEHGDKMSSFYASQASGYDAVREKMLVARKEMMSAFGPIKVGHTWLDIGGGTGRNIHFMRAQLDKFDTIIVLDICPELLEIGEQSARQSFTKAQCEKIKWVCADINNPKISEELAHVSWNRTRRGFDTITFSCESLEFYASLFAHCSDSPYARFRVDSISMIPKWEDALYSAKSLMSDQGRVLVSDFDTYTLEGNSFKDFLIHTWYKQDGVRIEAKTRDTIVNEVFSGSEFTTSVARMQRKLAGVMIPHFVACCRKSTVTTPGGFRRSLTPDLLDFTSIEEKKSD